MHDSVKEAADRAEAATVALWGKAYPQLEAALSRYEQSNSESLPDTSWIPFRNSKEGNRKEMEEIVDAVIRMLESFVAHECRKKILDLQKAVTRSLEKVAVYREQLISTPPASRESLDGAVRADLAKVSEMRQQIEQLREHFRTHLQEIGIDIGDSELDSLLMPVTEDDLVAMAGLIFNIAALTVQLEKLTVESKESPPTLESITACIFCWSTHSTVSKPVLLKK